MKTPVVENPIQQVLEAERAAKKQIDAARHQVASAIAAARRQAKAILSRNEARTQRVIERFEQQENKLLEAEAEKLRHASKRELDEYKTKLTNGFKQIIDETFKEFWPELDNNCQRDTASTNMEPIPDETPTKPRR